jgi:Ca2+-binding RTX toxin-like protein
VTTVTVLSGPEPRRQWTTAQKLRIDYVPNLSDAVHSFSASAKDVAGNQGNSSPVAVLGSSTKDTVSGAVAADLIEGFGGPDILIGGTGADTFIFHAGFGKDTISSFDLSKDVLAFDHNLFANVAAILANTTTDAKTGYAVITYDSADTVTLNGITKANYRAI